MAPLDRAGGAVGVEERDALAALMAAARIGDPVAAGGAKSPAQRPADGVTVGVERIAKRAGAVPEIMGVEADIEHDLAELGGPAFGFGGSRHESRLVMDGTRSEEHTPRLQSL